MLRVLVVDDSAGNRTLMARALRNALTQALRTGRLGTRFGSVEIVEADDGDTTVELVTGIPAAEALAIAAGDRASPCGTHLEQAQDKYGQPVRTYHGVTLDAEMPRMAGYTAAPILRAAGYRGPIVGCTGNALPDDQLMFLHAGADKILAKPVQIGGLADVFIAAWANAGLVTSVPAS